MGAANNLFSSTEAYRLREALKEFGKIYGVKDSNTFMQILLRGTQGGVDVSDPSSDDLSESASQTGGALEEIADAILALQGDGIYVDKMIDIFENFIAGNATDELADHFKNPPTMTDPPTISITSANSHSNGDRGYLRQRSVNEILGVPAFPEEDKISIIEMHHPNLNFSNRDTMASSIFLMALPSIEISKCVPYMDVKTIVKNSPTSPKNGDPSGETVFTNGISIYKFLNGEKIEPDNSTIIDLVAGTPMEFKEPPPVLDGVSGSLPAEKPLPTVAGMEIFTTPQSLVNADFMHVDLDASKNNYGPDSNPQDIPIDNKVLDKFRPLLTMESMSLTVTPATGMLATKSAEIKVKLHDKTRMNQVMPLIVPAQLGDVEFLIEWGWSHPISDPEVNPYGALINSMRCREKYGLSNSSYSFSPEGQVDLSLKLYTKGAQKATFELVSNDPNNKHPSDVLKDLVRSIRTAMKDLKQEGFVLNAEMGAPDVLGKASSVGGLLSLSEEDLGKIRTFIENMAANSAGTSSSDEWANLTSSWNAAEAGVIDFKDKIEEIFLDKINAVAHPRISRQTPDPYLIADRATIENGVEIMNISHNTHVSLAKVLLHFLAQPVRSTGRFDEIQMIFYPMNEYAMWARGLNVGQYPINKATFKELVLEHLQKSPSMTIQKFLTMMKKLFVNFNGDDVYGLSTFYGTDDEGKRVVNEQYTKDEEGKQLFASKKTKVMEACYGRDGEKRFKKPNIQMFVECVANIEQKNSTILRFHFFDKNTTSFSSYAQLWQATSASDLGIIGKYVNSKKSLDKAMQNPPPQGSQDYENWEQLVENRTARFSNFEDQARVQLQQFVDNGLIEPMTVGTTTTDASGAQVPDTVTKYRIRGGPDQLRGILAANMPTLKYGTEYSGILNASLSTQSNPQMETIHMQRQMAGGAGPTGAVDDGLPMTIKPVELSLDTFGCPFINFGQQFFVDFQTNTTIDDIYAVSGVSHTISPSEFKTQIKLMPLNKLGQFRSMTDQFDDAMAIASETGENTSGN